jgi:signal transduction histidine kinase
MFIALPVFSDGKVIGIVRASRTRLALSSLWANRRGLLWLALGIGALLMALSILFAAKTARPLGRLTRAAQRVAQGASARDLTLSGSAPREVAELQEVLSAMAFRLETRASYVREFASQVSHELKTPITRREAPRSSPCCERRGCRAQGVLTCTTGSTCLLKRLSKRCAPR